MSKVTPLKRQGWREKVAHGSDRSTEWVRHLLCLGWCTGTGSGSTGPTEPPPETLNER